MSEDVGESQMTLEGTATDEQITEPARAAQPKSSARKGKQPAELIREPGKSVLPFSRVQKILKADKDLIMMQREATFMVSKATEHFVQRFVEEIQRVADREKRTTVQQRDVVTMVKRADEFAFLEELFPWSSAAAPAPRQPRAAQGKKGANKNKSHATLDAFVKDSGQDEPQDEEQGGDADFVMNEDGTMGMAPTSP